MYIHNLVVHRCLTRSLRSAINHAGAQGDALKPRLRRRRAARRSGATLVTSSSGRSEVTKALYLIAEDLDTTTLLAEATSRNVAATAAMLATAADADFENLMAVAFAVFSGIAGSKRIVFERGPSLLALQELHRELSLMCQSYLLASRRGRQGD